MTAWRKSSYSAANGHCVEVSACVNHGCVDVRDSKHRGGELLHFTAAEWAAFLRGVVAGEFGSIAEDDLRQALAAKEDASLLNGPPQDLT